MKSTGMIRKVDELGRIVIPKEIRNSLEIYERDSMEIFIDGHSIVLKKFEENCIFCGNNKNLISFNNKLLCNKCLKQLQLNQYNEFIKSPI